MSKYQTREQWLIAAISEMTPLFEAAGYKIPEVRVTCGWPSRGGTSAKKRTLGQCWDGEAAADGQNQIFISPFIENTEEDYSVLPVLVHEVVHAVVGVAAKHGKIFRKCAEAVGLTGKMTSTVPGDALKETIKKWQGVLGEYPHAKLDPRQSPVKKQTTRMIKMTCKECGYVARTSRKWLDEVGAAHCPKHGVMEFELPAGDDDGGEGEGDE